MPKYRLVQISRACPEQYDVFRGDEQVGYIRLRHGTLRVDVPDCGGKTVFYTRDFDGVGSFSSEEERQRILRVAVEAIDKELEPLFEVVPLDDPEED